MVNTIFFRKENSVKLRNYFSRKFCNIKKLKIEKKTMMNKNGWLRIVEAFLAVLIIAGVIIVILAGKAGNNSNKEEAIYNLQKTILNEFSNNDDLREAVLNAADSNGDGRINSIYEENEPNYVTIKEFVSARIPAVFGFEVQICIDINDVCGPEEYKPEMYTNEIVVSSTLQDYNPRKLKLFIWEK